jgi:hypothetical protein
LPGHGTSVRKAATAENSKRISGLKSKYLFPTFHPFLFDPASSQGILSRVEVAAGRGGRIERGARKDAKTQNKNTKRG